MNKLEGLYELKNLKIPSIDWQIYNHDTILDNNRLWTIRSAIYKGLDLNLPRLFGKDAHTSKLFADKLLNQIKDKGIVIYYPYLIAEKSGILQFKKDRTIVEVVEGDLGNLLNGSKVDVTYIWNAEAKEITGDKDFLSSSDQFCLLSYVDYLKRRYSEYMLLGYEIQLEFSFAFDCSSNGDKVGNRKLVFFEIRTL